MVAEANMRAHSRMQQVRLGVFLPHEVVSSFYHFRSGDLFYSMLTGTPSVLQLDLMIFLLLHVAKISG